MTHQTYWCKKMQNSEKSDFETISSIVEMRRRNEDEEKQWDLIGDLQNNGSPKVHKRCVAMCKSGDPFEREIAADILGRLGWQGGKQPFREKSIPAITPLLKDSYEQVVDAAIIALWNLRAREAILAHTYLARDQSDLIRFSMARCLGSFLDAPKARRTLIKQSGDQDTDVRNWATFGLGALCDHDTKEIRTALYNRLNDDDEETRNEAILGLARRKIQDVLPMLVRELEGEPGNPSPLAIESAGELLSQELLEPLKRILEATGDPQGTVNDVIKRIENLRC